MADAAVAETALEITLRCATGLKKVNLVSKMEVYALVSISTGDNNSVNTSVKTPPDRDGGSNPTWDFPIKFAVDEAALRQDRLTLDFKLVCERALGDKNVGEVHVSVKELLESGGNGGRRFVTYQVTKPSGRPKGHLTFSYKFFSKTAKSDSSAPAETKSSLYPAIEMDLKSIYPPLGKLYEEIPAPESQSDSVYPPAPAELISNGMYPSAVQIYGELNFRSLFPAVEHRRILSQSGVRAADIAGDDTPPGLGGGAPYVYPPPAAGGIEEYRYVVYPPPRNHRFGVELVAGVHYY
ncbi:protein SRC2-like [Andrographis paniculata]|uniref:protein SRC2-like n=1 Tax=Andrographis paniculata TaxID=175694 RepID=UPI0021E99564|nr:protein SRC2-like [Andrographis paniculata]